MLFCPFVNGACMSDCIFNNCCFDEGDPENCNLMDAIRNIRSDGFTEKTPGDYLSDIEAWLRSIDFNTNSDQTDSNVTFCFSNCLQVANRSAFASEISRLLFAKILTISPIILMFCCRLSETAVSFSSFITSNSDIALFPSIMYLPFFLKNSLLLSCQT